MKNILILLESLEEKEKMKGFTKGMFHGGTLVEGCEATVYTLNLLISVSAPSGAKLLQFFSY